jgi:hypothetical protein
MSVDAGLERHAEPEGGWVSGPEVFTTGMGPNDRNSVVGFGGKVPEVFSAGPEPGDGMEIEAG